MSVSLKLVLHPLGWEHPQIQTGDPRAEGPPLPRRPSNLSWYLLLPRNSQCSPAEKKLKLVMLGLDGVPGGDSPDHQLLGRGTSDRRVMGTHRAGILPPGWSVVSSSGPGTGPSLSLHSRLSPEGGLRSVGALAAGSTQARGRGKEERWDLGSGELGTKVPGPCASEFQVLGGTQGSSLPNCRKQQQ